MLKVSPCHTRNVTTPIEEAFTKAVNKAESNNRVSTANLRELLRKVNNAQGEISYEALGEIYTQTDRLFEILNNQNSSIWQKKADKIEHAYMGATHRISQEGAQKHYNDLIQMTENNIKQCKEFVKSNIEALKKSFTEIDFKINNNI